MQHLNSSHRACKDQDFHKRDEIFRANKLLLHSPENSDETNGILNCHGESKEDNEYGPVHENFPKLENLPKPTSEISSKNSSDSYKDSLRKEQLNDSYKAHTDITINLTSSTLQKNELQKDSSFLGGPKTNNYFLRTKKVRDIVSTSRSGHLIERKSDSCYMGPMKGKVDTSQDCDSNDNIISTFSLPCSEMHDINDNPNDEGEEQVNLDDNSKGDISDGETPCGIGLLERLIRSHPVWFLPGIQRAGAFHLLQGKEEGNFIVRQSSQPDTMAVSVRLPLGKGPYIEHYLIQSVQGQLSLESSENMFESIPSLIAHYCQCCDELPVQLSLPKTIQEAKNRQQLSSLALLGQEFWRYPLANPRPPEPRNASPNDNKSNSCPSFEKAKKVNKRSNEIILDLVPLHQNTQAPNILSTFKSSPIEEFPSSSVEEYKPKRPHTLDLICTNSEKTAVLFGNKTPPQPPPRCLKLSPSVSGQQFSSFASITTVSSTIDNSQINQEKLCEDGERPEPEDISAFVSSAHPSTNSNETSLKHGRKTSTPDSSNSKFFSFDKDALAKHQDGKNSHLVSPVSDNGVLISKSFEKAAKSLPATSTPTEKNERMFKRYKKVKEGTHYQECDILESPTLYYYRSNVTDKQSDYEDIWATDSLTTFKPSSGSLMETENHPENEKESRKPPDLLEKLENSFFSEKKDEKIVSNARPPSESDNCDNQNGDEDNDVKQNSPFYSEPADALVVRRKTRLSFNKSRHSDPFSFNNWSPNSNPYFSGSNVLDRIDSQNEMNEDSNWKTKPSLSFDNIINLKKKESERKSKLNLKSKNVIKAKPVRPPKVESGPSEKNPQNWAVDSSWEFIGNDENEREGERRFPSIEQQMDSDEASYKCTVQEIISQRFPQFTISRGFGPPMSRNHGSKENSILTPQTSFRKSCSSKTGSRISAYDNLTCDRFLFFNKSNDSDKNSEMNCDTSIGFSGGYEESKSGLGESFPSRNNMFSDTLRSKKRVDCGSVTEDNEDAQTIFSEPWDSSRWENLIPPDRCKVEDSCFENVPSVEIALLNVGTTENATESFKTSDKFSHRKNFREGADFQLTVPTSGLKSKELSPTGSSIRSYALHLASDKSTTFAQNIDNFIECTLESKETNPQIVMRNMRQFMSGMKNYLVKHGEREFEKQVEKERMKLKSTEFLNLDAILEGVMHKLVVRPLREHLYKLFVDEYIKNGAIQLLYDNLIYARTRSLNDLGLKAKIAPPSQEALEVICHFISKLQEVDSPLEKLDHLLTCVSTIIHFAKSPNPVKTGIALGADDILPLFVWVLVQSGFIGAEIEAEYMWGLLHPSLLSGEGCYYLTTLSSAVHVLKNFKSCSMDQSKRMALNEWHCGDLKSVLKVIVPDELHGSILTKTLPVKPNMTTKDVCKIIAHKIRITNPQDYGLFRLVDGEETLLNDNECPQDVKSEYLESGKHCTLAYKRIDAKIGWPRTA